ncbi:hypothetical protein DL764_004461 [Monosporascus ibericus]|uniref:CDC20/Fizzy WD40 domain-containing protein n=1 Tax=Monosporascus ibericus TaxID=155417 RepID=A0A4Q4TFZ7_9PEZI|nr:hypothetical protein DL764_004461 [Monosporascus ibericus]
MTIESEPAAAMAPLPPAVPKRSADETDRPATRTPSRIATPPPPTDRGRLQASRNGENANSRSARTSGRVSDLVGGLGIDPDTLSRALSREFSADRRESTPGVSPSRKRQRINGDRFIPSRSGQDLQASFSLLHDEGSPATPSKQKKRTPHGELHFQRTEEANLDWGSANVLGVGLGSSVYMWNAQTSRVNKLCTLEDDTVTSVSWIQKGTHLAIGTGKGLVQIWDAEKTRRLRTMTGHTARVGSLAWNTHILSSGSRDRLIYHRDVRAPDQWMRKLMGHKQEVCGLKWNCEDGQLASGGNDNKLMVWDKLSETPLWKFSDHTAAVKAIAWSPHQRGLLASGGGTADRRIIFHDTVRGTVINEIDTGSQVCNIAWSKNSNEIVSTHGYSQNQIVVWKYPSMTQVVSLTGHTYRVLYLAMSPDGRTIVTGAGDETLRFWTTFGRRPGQREDGDSGGGRLADWGVIR